jgi:hypothetical protein
VNAYIKSKGSKLGLSKSRASILAKYLSLLMASLPFANRQMIVRVKVIKNLKILPTIIPKQRQ